jgi:VIT1/CCC1 family predicted Fe2+/Mn2+ transporter
MVPISPTATLVLAVSAASLLFLALLGAIGAKVGGANILRANASPSGFTFAMALTAGIGALVGKAV